MINSLKIQNFQNHQKSVLNFSEGLNVIHGDNDQGKSAVLRALNWVINNRPSGFGFQPKDKAESTVAVEVTLDEDSVIRKRGKKENCYLVNGTKFSALRSEVPSEVSNLFNLSSASYQSQYNPHFLFTDSPGEVAKKINKIVGLEEIDAVLGRIKAVKENNTREIKHLSDRVEKLSTKVEKYEQVDYLWERVQLLSKREEILEKKKAEFDRGLDLAEEYDELTTALETFQDVQSIKSKLAEIEQEYTLLEKMREEYQRLFRKITLLKSIDSKLSIYDVLDDLSDRVEVFAEKENELEELRKHKVTFGYSVMEIGHLDTKIEELNETISGIEKQIQKEKKRLKVCPLCDKPF